MNPPKPGPSGGSRAPGRAAGARGSRRRGRRRGAPAGPAAAEAALVEHYPRLVRLAYLALPDSAGPHGRVLTAHRLVQRSLRAASAARGGGPQGYELLRREVLRAALGRPPAGRLRGALAAAGLPQVLGLRLHPRAGGGAGLALDRALAALPAPARAAYALLGFEGLDEPAARAVLDAAGVADPREAVRKAAGLEGDRRLLAAGEFDPCTVQLRPTDLLRRRQRGRAGLTVGAVVAVGAVLLGLSAAGGSPRPYGAAGPPGASAASAQALDPASVVRVAPQAWTRTGRLDFTVWPARGSRTDDTALLRRALAVWASPGPSVQVSATPGTARTAPVQPPQLLYAGDADKATVVLFFDGLRIIRYAEARGGDGSGGAALDFAQVPGADVTTAAAVVVDRIDGNTRFLTAPWVAQAQTRDLLRPGQAAAPLHLAADGTTDPVRMPGAGAAAGACGASWPALQLRSSAQVLPQHAFVLSDLGDLSPVHLTFTPPPASGDSPDAAPREATGPAALASWAHSACRLGELRGQGVRAVNDWEFARTPLPEGAGPALWTCDRADTWRGPGRATVQFVPPDASPAATGTLAGRQSDGAACSRYGQDVMAGVMWKSPAGHWYVVAAGSREVISLTATNGLTASSEGPYLAARAPQSARPTLTARTSAGQTLHPLDAS